MTRCPLTNISSCSSPAQVGSASTAAPASRLPGAEHACRAWAWHTAPTPDQHHASSALRQGSTVQPAGGGCALCAGGDGGFIRLGLNFVTDQSQIPPQAAIEPANGTSKGSTQSGGRKRWVRRRQQPGLHVPAHLTSFWVGVVWGGGGEGGKVGWCCDRGSAACVWLQSCMHHAHPDLRQAACRCALTCCLQQEGPGAAHCLPGARAGGHSRSCGQGGLRQAAAEGEEGQDWEGMTRPRPPRRVAAGAAGGQQRRRRRHMGALGVSPGRPAAAAACTRVHAGRMAGAGCMTPCLAGSSQIAGSCATWALCAQRRGLPPPRGRCRVCCTPSPPPFLSCAFESLLQHSL